MGWKTRAISKTTGKKHYLDTLPEYYIVPRKLDIDTMQQISECQDSAEIDLIVKLKKLGLKKDELKDPENALSDQTIRMIRLGLLRGIHEHNFDDEDGNPLEWDESLVTEIMKYMETALEVFRLVMEFNAPLAKKNSSKSRT